MRYFYTCPLIAAYMAKYQRIDFGAEIRSIFDNLCTTDAEVAASPVRFYLDEKNLKELEPQPGDIVILKDTSCGEVVEFEHHSGKTVVQCGYFGSDGFNHIRMRMIEDIDTIIYRNTMPYFAPREDYNAPNN